MEDGLSALAGLLGGVEGMGMKPGGVLEERKLVTVLFADLAQSTALFAGRDADRCSPITGCSRRRGTNPKWL